jgi:N utilization substance protein B
VSPTEPDEPIEPIGPGAPEPLTVSGTRREARERAFHLLYECEVKGVGPDVVLAELPLRPDAFAVELVEGVEGHAAEIDALVAAHARNWELGRMPALDRALLRLATYELAHRPDVPTAAVINEAVELAKQYSTDDSGRFVNGVLSAVAAEVRPA